MLKHSLLGFLILMNSTILFSQEVWTIEMCIDYAVGNNIQVKQQEVAVEVNKINVSQAKDNMLPNLNASSSHGYMFGRSFDAVTNNYFTQKTLTGNWNMSSRFIVFNGFYNRNNIQKESLNLKASLEGLEKVKNNIKLQVISSYLDVLFNKENVTNTEKQLTTSLEQENNITELVKAGKLAESKLFEIQSQVEKERFTIVQSRNALDLSYLTLFQLLRLKDKTFDVVNSPTLEIIYDSIPSIDTIYRKALSSMPEVKELVYRKAVVEKELTIRKNERLPSVSLINSIGSQYSNRNEKFIGLDSNGLKQYTSEYSYSNQIRDNWFASVKLSLDIPIFNNFQTKHDINKIKFNIQEAEYEYQNQLDLLYKEVSTAQTEAKAAYKSYLSAEKTLKSMLKTYTDAKEKLKFGLITLTEFNIIKKDCALAESDLLQAKCTFIFKIKIINFYLGMF